MLFNSSEFLVFAFIFFSIYCLVKLKSRQRQLLVVVFSLVFYGWWNPAYISLLVLSGVIDYVLGKKIHLATDPRKRKVFLAASIFSNLSVLFLFKYLNFVLSNIEAFLSGAFGLPVSLVTEVPSFFLVLPVGISFYTFQSMSYSIDIYRGQLKPARDFLSFFTYLSMFPQLVAGPIVRAKDVLGQIESPSFGKGSLHGEREGWFYVARGLFKKLVIADNLAPYVNIYFSDFTTDGNPISWWIAASMFALQIYGDFSGYSDIAIGLGKWMGLNYPANFRHPYSAWNFREFWARWHISLSTWFRDYFYIPLGGSKKGFRMGIFYMALTMLISGLWHGANWTFVVWGAVHALFLGFERFAGVYDLKSIYLKLGYRLVTMLGVLIAWVYFRADSVGAANEFVSRMLGLEGVSSLSDFSSPLYSAFPLAILAAAVAWQQIQPKIDPSIQALKESPRLVGVYAVSLLLMALYFRGPGEQFIYFQF